MALKLFPNWKTVLRWGFVVAVIVLSAQAGRWLHSQIKNRTNVQAARVRKPIPYMVTLRETLHGPDGTVTPGSEYTWAVRSDGSRLLQVLNKVPQRTLNYSSGLQVDTNDQTFTKSSMNRRDGSVAELQRDPDSKCLNSMAGPPVFFPPEEVFLGEETIAGYRTAKITNGTITAWHALDYGCALVKQRWEFGGAEVSEQELVTLVGGEPDPHLFDVAAHYREVPPSERIRSSEKVCAKCNDHSDAVLKKLDEVYERLKAKQ